MKVAICTRSFRPEIGGLGTVAHSYATGFIENGWEPVVVTHSSAPAGYDAQFGYRVVRRPGFREFRRTLRGCDGVVFVHQSIVYILWSLFIGKPIVSTIHGHVGKGQTLQGKATSLVFELHLRLRPCSALISEAVRSPATRFAPVIGNPYDPEVFHLPTAPPEPGTIIFSGRLTRAKGIFHLTEALRLLRLRRSPQKVTFLGSGPDESELRNAVARAGLAESATFITHSEPHAVAQLLGRHQIAAIPSDWDEPFGLAALEAIACGCYVVAFPDGGLPFAVGEAGLLTADKSPAALADGIQRLLTDEALRKRIDENRRPHLERFSRRAIVARLIEMLRTERR